eukprot:6180543-Pleurochrysis_carterae.AAC.4
MFFLLVATPYHALNPCTITAAHQRPRFARSSTHVLLKIPRLHGSIFERAICALCLRSAGRDLLSITRSQAEKEFPNSPEVLNYFGELLVESGEVDEVRSRGQGGRADESCVRSFWGAACLVLKSGHGKGWGRDYL